MANKNVTQGVGGTHGRTVLCRLVSEQEFDSARETALALSRFGVYSNVFSDQSTMHRWLETMSMEPFFSVKLVCHMSEQISIKETGGQS